MADGTGVTSSLRDLRCRSCGRKLARYDLREGGLEIKCQRCGVVTVLVSGENPLHFQGPAVKYR